MNRKLVLLIALLVVSEVAGVAVGEWFYRLWRHAIPPVALSDFNSQAAHVACLLYGAGVGVLLFVWALIGMAVSRLTRGGTKPAATAAP